MSASLIDKPRVSAPKRFPASRIVIHRRKRREPIKRFPIPSFTNDDDERNFVANAAIWMAVLAIAPWGLFHILNFFYPDFLWISITPN